LKIRNVQRKILIVDRSEMFLERLKMRFEQEGYLVQTTTTSSKILEAMEKFHPDIVMIEVLMPGIDGFEMIKLLKWHRQSVKIIAMTSGGRINAVEYLEAIRLLGADFTLKKPFREEYLVNALKVIL